MRAGNLPMAEAKLRRAIELNRVHRPDSSDMAQSLGQLGSLLLQKGRGSLHVELTEALRCQQKAAEILRRIPPRSKTDRATALQGISSVRYELGQVAAAWRFDDYALKLLRKSLPPGDLRLSNALLKFGASTLRHGRADLAELMFCEAIKLLRENHVDTPKQTDILGGVGWLVSCLLVQAEAGEDTYKRNEWAKELCNEFGFDFAQRVEIAKQYPYRNAAAAGGGA